MKIYRRPDGFEVHDARGRDLAWARAAYGESMVEVVPAPQDQAELAKRAEIAKMRAFLASTDYKVIRQYEQSTLSAEEYAEVLRQRQEARDTINELEGV